MQQVERRMLNGRVYEAVETVAPALLAEAALRPASGIDNLAPPADKRPRFTLLDGRPTAAPTEHTQNYMQAMDIQRHQLLEHMRNRHAFMANQPQAIFDYPRTQLMPPPQPIFNIDTDESDDEGVVMGNLFSKYSSTSDISTAFSVDSESATLPDPDKRVFAAVFFNARTFQLAAGTSRSSVSSATEQTLAARHLNARVEKAVASIKQKKLNLLSPVQREHLENLMSIYATVDPHYIIDQLLLNVYQPDAVSIVAERK
jgi:hypothetical protein